MARERGASGAGVSAGQFPAVREEHEGVVGQYRCVVFCNFLVGVGGGCSEHEVHGENTLFIILVSREAARGS
jgi:hypothetical protein